MRLSVMSSLIGSSCLVGRDRISRRAASPEDICFGQTFHEIFGENLEAISDLSTVYQRLFRRYGEGFLRLRWRFVRTLHLDIQGWIVQRRGQIE
jgi:hypothetical protein